MSRKVKFKFISIPISYNKIDALLKTGAEFCSKPEEIPDSAVRNGLYYVLSGRNEYIEFVHTKNDEWIKVYSTNSSLVSIEFNGYHRLLTKKEMDLLNKVKCNQLARYWRNLRNIQNLNNSLNLRHKDTAKNLLKRKRRYLGAYLFYLTSLDKFY